jgi:hypothetical protein
MDLKLQIQSLQKKHLTMQAYLDQKPSLADRLRLISFPVLDVDLQLFVLNGLSIEYDSLVVSLNSKSDVIPFNELVGLLLTHEQCLQKHALVVAGSTSSKFSTSLTAYDFSSTPQINLVTSPQLDISLASDEDLMSRFLAFSCITWSMTW